MHKRRIWLKSYNYTAYVSLLVSIQDSAHQPLPHDADTNDRHIWMVRLLSWTTELRKEGIVPPSSGKGDSTWPSRPFNSTLWGSGCDDILEDHTPKVGLGWRESWAQIHLQIWILIWSINTHEESEHSVHLASAQAVWSNIEHPEATAWDTCTRNTRWMQDIVWGEPELTVSVCSHSMS